MGKNILRISFFCKKDQRIKEGVTSRVNGIKNKAIKLLKMTLMLEDIFWRRVIFQKWT